MERVRYQWGENCSFSLPFFGDMDINFDLGILPGNVSTTTKPSSTTSEILSATTMLSFDTTDDREKEKEQSPTGTMSFCVLFLV